MQYVSMTLMLGVAATTAMLAAPAHANLLTHAPLDGTGPLQGTGGGTGWHTHTWDTQNGATGYAYATATPLAYPNLERTNGYATGGDSYVSTGRRLDTGGGGLWDQAGRTSDPWTAGRIDQGVVYASFLIRKDQSNGDEVRVGTTSANIPWSDTGFVGAVLKNNGVLELGANGTNIASTLGHTVGQASLIVLKYDLDADTVGMYVDPALGTEPATANATASLAAGYGFRNAYAYLGNGTGQGSFDELRFGTTFASVTPGAVPEPAAAGLLGAAGLIAMRRRRNRC